MLKGISRCLSPDLMKMMMEMGHGDELVLADGNFPSASTAQRLVRADGQHIIDLLDAILRYFPLDDFVPRPVVLMEVVPGHDYDPVIWKDYHERIKTHEPNFNGFEYLERNAFYERTRAAYGVVATGEKSLYANVIIKKGVVID
jgi:L-fucose mutarotase